MGPGLRFLSIMTLVGASAGALVAPAVANEPARAGAGSNAARSDFNGDGFGDLAIGIVGEEVAGLEGAGAIHILYGSADGLTTTGAQHFTQDSPAFPGDPAQGGSFGWSLAPGDFDGDGLGDLAIGSPFVDVGTHDGAGAVTIMYGTETGLHEFNSVLWTEDHEGFPGSARSHDVFGYDLVAGNFGKGPEQDLVIGAPGRDVSGQNGAGAMFVLYGSPGGAQNEGAKMFTEATEGVPGNPALNDGLGGSLAAGNLGHGGRSDLVAGMPTKDHGHIDNGMALVLYGTPDGLSAAHAQVWYEEKVAVQSGDGDEFGWSVAVGNFGKGKTGDLAVGVPNRDLGDQLAAGVVVVVYGTSAGLSSAGAQEFTQANTGTGAVEQGDQFGTALAAGNLGHSTHADLAIGVPSEAIGSTGGAGAVDIVYGSPAGLTFTGAQGFTQASLGGVGAVEANDGFGGRVFIADFGRGTEADVAIGVTGEDIGAVMDAGAADVGFGSPSGITTDGAEGWGENNAGAGVTVTKDDRFGFDLG